MKHACIPLLTILIVTSCGSQRDTVIPLTTEFSGDTAYTILWRGTSTAYRFSDGKYVSDPAYNYLFTVTQQRFQNEWHSIKDMHRLHPDYDGRAGERDQTMYFELAYAAMGDSIRSVIRSSLGSGLGRTDPEFRKQQFTIALKDPGAFDPYDHIRITQHYAYEEGVLRETVELFKLKNGVEIPFMKNDEVAYFHLQGALEEAPTRFDWR